MRLRTVILCAAVVILSAVLQAQPACSLDMLTGTYAVRGAFTVYMPVQGAPQPVAIPQVYVGIASINADGSATLKAFGTAGGDPAEISVTATVTVAPDCTGVVTYSGNNVGQGTNQIVIFDNGDQVSTIPVTNTLVAIAGGETWKRLSRLPANLFSAWTPCTPDMVHGTYALRYDGWIMTPMPSGQMAAMPASIVGTSFSDNMNRSVGRYTVNVGGTTRNEGWTSDPNAITVNAGCTGSVTYSAPDGSWTAIDRFVLVNGGREFWSVTVKGAAPLKPAIVGVFKQISTQPMAQ